MKIDRLLERTHTADCKRVRPTRATRADGNDIIQGGKGDDLIRGGRDNDQLLGGEGNDVLDGGLGVAANDRKWRVAA